MSLPNEQRRGRRNLNFSTSEDLSEEEEEEHGDTVRVLIIISQLDMSLGVPSQLPEENLSLASYTYPRLLQNNISADWSFFSSTTCAAVALGQAEKSVGDWMAGGR